MIVRGIDLRGLHMQHFGCFGCRKAFKQRGSEESAAVAEAPLPRPFPCPKCGRPMAAVGRDFEAPPQRDRKGWLAAELLHSFGVAFEPGICGPGYRPRGLREMIAFLAARGHDAVAVAERLRRLRRWRVGAAPDAEPGAAADTGRL